MSDDKKKKIEENKEAFLNEIAQDEADLLEEDVAGGGNGNNCICNDKDAFDQPH